MTALSGAIIFNNGGSGSDTTASGCGPATTITQTLMFSSGSATTNMSSTSGLSAGDIIYVPSNTGRKFNVIASVDTSSTVTCDENWDDSQMGVSGYIGGKRSTIDNADSRLLFHDDVSDEGWNIEIEYTGTDYALTSRLDLSGTKTITGTGSTKPSISVSAFADTALEVQAGYSSLTLLQSYFFSNLDISGSADRIYGSSTVAISPSTGGLYWVFDNCTFNNGVGDLQVVVEPGVGSWGFRNCSFTGSVASINAGGSDTYCLGNYFNGGQYSVIGSSASINCQSCVFDTQTVKAVQARKNNLINNIFYSSAIGVDNGDTSGKNAASIIYGNIFHSCTTALDGYDSLNIQGNGFYNNTTKYSLGNSSVSWTRSDVDFSSDPLIDPANNNFKLASGVTSEVNSYLPLGAASTSGEAPSLESLTLRSFDSSTSSGSGGSIFHPLAQ
jgi:hypothetical protein